MLAVYVALAAFLLAAMMFLVSMGRNFVGPLRFLQVLEIKRKSSGTPKGRILFYGASNFRLWEQMRQDLAPFPVLNHGFGGSTDKDLVHYGPQLLYPFEPKCVVFQTGSNDYVPLPGTDEEKICACMVYKDIMFRQFRQKLPDAEFVVMSGLLLPGRSEYLRLTCEINEQLKEYCAEREHMTFVDAQELTWDGKSFREDLFIQDGIHLNHQGQLKWAEGYILPVLRELYTAENQK